jgi:hypothetical protein
MGLLVLGAVYDWPSSLKSQAYLTIIIWNLSRLQRLSVPNWMIVYVPPLCITCGTWTERITINLAFNQA